MEEKLTFIALMSKFFFLLMQLMKVNDEGSKCSKLGEMYACFVYYKKTLTEN